MTMMRSFIAGSVFVPAAALLLAGCAVDTGAADGADPENTAEAQSAYGESTCGTTAGVFYTEPDTNWNPGSSKDKTTTSNYNPAGCANTYLIEYQNVYNAAAANIYWTGSVSTSATVCGLETINATVYSATGAAIGTQTAHGTWVSGVCHAPEILGMPMYSTGLPNGNRRLAIQAYEPRLGLGGGATYHAMQVHAWVPAG